MRILLILPALSLSACSTVQGIGQDVEKGGQAIEKAVK